MGSSPSAPTTSVLVAMLRPSSLPTGAGNLMAWTTIPSWSPPRCSIECRPTNGPRRSTPASSPTSSDYPRTSATKSSRTPGGCPRSFVGDLTAESARRGPRRSFLLRRPDWLLGDERGDDGTPSATDFLLHDLAPIIDRLAEDDEGSTVEVSGAPGVRVLLAGGTMVPFIAVYATLDDDDGVDIIDVGLDRRGR